MTGRNLIETVMGAVVLLLAAGFTFFAYESSNVKSVEGFRLEARFQTVDGLSVGSDVRIGGIKVGRVDSMTLDTDTYQAQVTFEIKENTPVPEDSVASVVSDGLLGGKYVAIEPGAEDLLLEDGGVIHYTQSSVNFETLLGKMVHGSAESGAE